MRTFYIQAVKGAFMEKILNWLAENGTVITGATFAFLISMLTSRKGTLMDKLGNSLLCSLFSTGIYYGILTFFPDCSPYLAVAVGTFVGAFGVDDCKRLIKGKLDQWLSVDKDKDVKN